LVTLNELLIASGIDPAQVTLLRHSGTSRLGITPYDLWQRRDGSFDRYQSTQALGKALFHSPYWASFVSNPAKETLFVGLYSASLGDRAEIDWLCPMTGMPPGADKGREADLYHLTLLDTFREHRGILKIQWDTGWVAWARYASRSDHAIVSGADIRKITAFAASPEGEATWQMQRKVERNSRIAKAALAKNAEMHGGVHVCEACGFQHSDRAMFDAHHPHPIAAGPRMTQAYSLIVLCPLCHRRAHRSTNRMLPYKLEELLAWNEAGRP
jgi:hypothetical protein